MRMRYLAFLLMVAHAPAFGAEESVKMGLNCGYWNTALVGDAFVVAKVLFVRGAYEGATALHLDIFDAAERSAEPGQQPQNVMQVSELFEKRYYRKTGYLVLVDSLDKFCKDPQNEIVWLTGAIKVVSMQLREESSEVIDAEVNRLRRDPGP